MTDIQKLISHLDRIAGTAITCVGDVMLDCFVRGDVDRISPEAPIPVLRVIEETEMLGGAGNVARNLAALKARCLFVAVVGNDAIGRRVTELLAAEPGAEPWLVTEVGRHTGIKTRYLAGGQQLLRADRESIAAIGDHTAQEVLANADIQGALVLSDYGKGVLRADIVQKLIERTAARGVPVIVDPKGDDFTRYRGATVITPNRKELALATRMAVETEAEIVAAARTVREQCDIANVLVTRGRDGMTLLHADGSIRHLPAEAREVFDVSGAGDTVVATVAAALAARIPIEEAALLANVAAGIVVGKVGTAVAYPEDVLASLHRQDISQAESKLASLEQIAERARRWRRQGMTVGFTNGCFDLLHAGHVALLAQARAACDKLVVGLNSDASVKRLKGEGRPVQSEAARGVVLAALESVDAVVVFEDDTPMRLIEALRPDVLVKGADYTLDRVVGGEFVTGYGGRVLLAELVPGHSTTATIARMGERKN